LTMVKSGLTYSYGMGFWGANGHDGIWHIALSESFKRGSFAIPIFASGNLQNYHIGFDLLLAFLSKITAISTVNLYFQILPIFFSILLGMLVYKFVYDWKSSESAALWSTFFVYFGGSFGFVLGKGESAFWSQEAISTLINPPFTLSLIFLMFGLILIRHLNFRQQAVNTILLGVVMGLLIEIKAYAGVLGLFALLVTAVYEFFYSRKSKLLTSFFIALPLSLIVYLPLNSLSGGLFVFHPFWFLETMMGLADRINWQKYYSAMVNYREGHVYIKGVIAYIAAFGLFILGNFGTRLIFVFRKWKISTIDIFINTIISVGIIVPMLFVQKGTPWNSIQFIYYSLFFGSILSGMAMSELSKKFSRNKIIWQLGLVFITLPTTFFTLKDVYIPARPPAMIPNAELSALKFLANQPTGIVLTEPFDEFKSKMAENSPPRPLYLYTSTAYVSAFAKHPVMLEDQINLDIMNYDWRPRNQQIKDWYVEKDYPKSRNFLIQNNIKYIYWIKMGQSPLDLKKLGVENIYENESVTIYKVV
jgi:hypothetical protein